MSEFPTSGEGQQTPTELDLAMLSLSTELAQRDYESGHDIYWGKAYSEDVPLLVAEVERLRSQLDDARGKAGRLEKELHDKSQTVLALHWATSSGSRYPAICRQCQIAWPCPTYALFAGPSSVAEFEALGTPVKDKK